MILHRDPEAVAQLARLCEDENWRFRTFLKGVDLEIEELDAIVHRHYEEVAGLIDCCSCGNCCRRLLPTLDEADVCRLAAGLETTADDVVNQYLARNDDGDLTFNRSPCPFLSGTRCRVYEHRPNTCRSYPHLHKRKFIIRLAQAVGNCSVCPITFTVFERLKEELWHPRRSRVPRDD